MNFELDGVSVGYSDRPVVHDLSVSLAAGGVICLIGPNGCGKSTLLSAMCGLLPHTGTLNFAGNEINDWERRARAQRLGLLPQNPVAPAGLTVGQLIRRGRHPYQSWLSQWSTGDDPVVERAMEMCDVQSLADRPLSDLSGGQRQRVWIAMTTAQDTDTLLLDEPTTYLDLATSVSVLRLVRTLADAHSTSIIMVLHDLNLAARFSDSILMLNSSGGLSAFGSPAEVITEQSLRANFGLDALVVEDPVSGGPMVVPR